MRGFKFKDIVIGSFFGALFCMIFEYASKKGYRRIKKRYMSNLLPAADLKLKRFKGEKELIAYLINTAAKEGKVYISDSHLPFALNDSTIKDLVSYGYNVNEEIYEKAAGGVQYSYTITWGGSDKERMGRYFKFVNGKLMSDPVIDDDEREELNNKVMMEDFKEALYENDILSDSDIVDEFDDDDIADEELFYTSESKEDENEKKWNRRKVKQMIDASGFDEPDKTYDKNLLKHSVAHKVVDRREDTLGGFLKAAGQINKNIFDLKTKAVIDDIIDD